MMSVVLLELTTEYTEYTERKKISRNTAASRLTESHRKNLWMGVRDTNLLGISVFSVSKAAFCVFSSLYCDESI